jgi:6-phosphofructo-2-kinase
VKDYIARINAKVPDYETINETDLTYIRLININQRMEVRNAKGYLASRIVFYLMNLHTQRRTLYFARAGRSTNPTFKSDNGLSHEGKEYARLLAKRLLSFREEEHSRELAQGERPRSLTVYSLVTGFIVDLDVHAIKNKTNCRRIFRGDKTFLKTGIGTIESRGLRWFDCAGNPNSMARGNGMEKKGSLSSSIPSC